MISNLRAKLAIIIPLIAICAGGALFLYFCFTVIYKNAFWQSALENVTTFGKDCEGATGIKDDHWTFEAALRQPHNFLSQGLPFRIYPETAQRRIQPGEYWINRCKLDLSQLAKDDFSLLSIGRFTGRVAVFLGDRKVLMQRDNGSIAFPLLPEDKVDGIMLTLITDATMNGLGAVGPGTLVPPFYTDNRRAAVEIDKLGGSPATSEFSFFRIILTLAFLSVFSTVWLLGIRYPDISWMVVTLSAYAVYWTAEYIWPDRARNSFADNVFDCLILFYSYGFLCFIHSFLRMEFLKNKLPWIVPTIIGIYLVLQTFFPGYTVRNVGFFRLMNDGLSFVGALGITLLSFSGISKITTVRKSKYFSFVGIVVMYGVLSFIHLFPEIDVKYPISRYIFLLMIIVSSCVMVADLAVFQRNFLEEKQHNITVKKENELLADSLVLGKKVQSLLFQKRRSGTVRNVRFEFFHEANMPLSGNWFHYWISSNGTSNFVLGDVVGKGPSAALAVSAIFASIEKSKQDDSRIELCLENIHQTLLNLFDGYMNSTAMALSIDVHGSMHSWNYGGSGWALLGDLGVDSRYVQGERLGLGNEFCTQKISWQANSGDIIIAKTDGVLTGNHEAYSRKILDGGLRQNPADFEKIYLARSSVMPDLASSADTTTFILQVLG